MIKSAGVPGFRLGHSRPLLWSMVNIVAFHLAGPRSIPGRISFSGWGFSSTVRRISGKRRPLHPRISLSIMIIKIISLQAKCWRALKPHTCYSSVTTCGFCGGRNGVWEGFSRGFSHFPLPQISFHHFSTLISSISFHFHFIRPCNGASGVVGRPPCYSKGVASSHLIPLPGPASVTSWGYLFYWLNMRQKSQFIF